MLLIVKQAKGRMPIEPIKPIMPKAQTPKKTLP